MNRNHAIDFIKGFGLLLIAGLHIGLFNKINDTAVFSFNTVMRFAVPFFFLTSGYLLFSKLKKSEQVQPILLAYIRRIGKYYVLGLSFCFLFDYFITRPIMNLPFLFLSCVDYKPGFTSGTLFGDIAYYGLGLVSGLHLWFLIAMVWSAIAIFLFCRNNPANIKTLTILAFLLHLVGLFGLSQPYAHFAALPLYPRDAAFFGLFYLCLGGFWAMYGLHVKKFIPEKWLLPAIILFSILQLTERAAIVFSFHAPWRSDWGEYFISTIPLTIVLFQYALDNANRFAGNWLTRVGEHSIGVYILHMPVLRTIRIITDKVINMPQLWRELWFQLMVPFVAIAASYFIYIMILRCINIFAVKRDYTIKS